MRLKGLTDPRGIEVHQAAGGDDEMGEPRRRRRRIAPARSSRGRGIAYIHYKHQETYVAMGMEVAVERATGRIQVERVVCAHDCGQIINPDGVRAQVEGNIIQTLSRVLMEEVKFDRSRVTSVDWASYPIMRFSEVPKLEIALIDRPTSRRSAPARPRRRRSARRSATRCSTRRACACANCRSRRSASRRRWPADRADRRADLAEI